MAEWLEKKKKKAVAYPSLGTLLCNKKAQIIDTGNDLGEFPGNSVELKLPTLRGYVLYSSIYINSWNERVIEMDNTLVFARI